MRLRAVMAGCLLACGLTLIATTGHAAEPGSDPVDLRYDTTESRERFAGPGFLDVSLKLVFVLGLIGITAGLYRRFGRPGVAAGGADGDVIRVWANRSLGLGSEMYLVEVGDRMILIGRSGSSLNTLSEFADPNVIATLKAGCGTPLSLATGSGPWNRFFRGEVRR